MTIALECPDDTGVPTPTDQLEAWVKDLITHSLVVFELASGRYNSAFRLASASPLDDDLISEVTIADIIEAAVRSGHHTYAVALLAGPAAA